jgi:hypothetical protein
MEVVMKTKTLIAVVMLLSVSLCNAQTQDFTLPVNLDKEQVEENLLTGLKTDNSGLQYSCALMLGQIKSTRAVIPLMALLRKCDNLKLKTASAWALCNIGDPRGTFAVKREAQFNSCCIAKLRCAWYYETMVQSGTFIFTQEGQNLYAELKTDK